MPLAGLQIVSSLEVFAMPLKLLWQLPNRLAGYLFFWATQLR